MVQRTENLVVVNGVHPGAFIPSSKDRLLTDVILQEGFHIRGGLYANNITVEGPGIVDSTVMAKRDIVIYPPEDLVNRDKRIVFRCGLSAKLAITVNVPTTFQYSPLNHVGFIPLLIRGDVIAQSVRLDNAVVVGSVFANEAVIKDSIILGCLLVQDQLVLRNTMAVSFRAGSVRLEGRNSLWVPYGLAEHDIAFAEYRPDEEEEGQLEVSRQSVEDPSYRPEDAGKAWVRYIAICREPAHACANPNRVLVCHEHMAGTCRSRDVRMGEEDKVGLRRGGKAMVALTMAPRFVDLRKVRANLEELVDLLSDFLLLEHYSEGSRQKVLGKVKALAGDNSDEMPPHYQLLQNVADFALPPRKGPDL